MVCDSMVSYGIDSNSRTLYVGVHGCMGMGLAVMVRNHTDIVQHHMNRFDV